MSVLKPPFQVGPGTLQAGIYSYKDLPLPGAFVFEDFDDVSSYSYDPVKHELVSYDIPDVVRTKADYIMANSLGGCMFWEVCRILYHVTLTGDLPCVAFD